MSITKKKGKIHMKTLVIHPQDPSTDFLIHIYEHIECDVLSDPDMTELSVYLELWKYDRIICLGHGCPSGLLNSWGDLVVNEFHVDSLQDKELICIWCNADKFMDNHNLRGLYSGMFISEVEEAMWFNVKCTQEQVTDSNYKFAIDLGYLIEDPDRITKLKESYVLPGNDVAVFNNERLYERLKYQENKENTYYEGEIL